MTHLNLPERIHGDLRKEPCINDGESPLAVLTLKTLNDIAEIKTRNSAFKKFYNSSPLCALLDSSLIELNAKSPT